MNGPQAKPGESLFSAEDADLLRWVAGWLDTSDPILQAVFKNPAFESVYTQEQREKVVAWLDGKEIQARLRTLADRMETA